MISNLVGHILITAHGQNHLIPMFEGRKLHKKDLDQI